MPRDISVSDAEIVARTCLGAITGPDGATHEQLAVLRSVVTHLWQIDDVDLSPTAALNPEEAAAQLTDEMLRRRTRELMVLLELCRHPLEASHEQRVEDYCHALGGDGPGIELARNIVQRGSEAALEDWLRRFTEKAPEMMEPAMIEIASIDDEGIAAERFAEIDAALHSAGPGTLGAAFVDFYDRNGFTVGPEAIPLMGHDMAHVIGGYDATSIGEICIGAMKLMITDSDIHWLEFLGNVMIHEAGLVPDGYAKHDAALTTDENIEMMARALERGRETKLDFSTGEHLSMIDWPLDEVRAHFGVPPL
jgi:hypothetical protein